MKKLLFWIRNARYQALPQSALPAILAICMASRNNDFSLSLSLVALFGILLAHLSLNLFDDYFDYRHKDSNFRDRLQHEGFRARLYKCHYLTSGATTLSELLRFCLIFGAIALLCGGVIGYFRGFIILWLVLAGALLGISYSGAPLRLSYRGLGEILIGIMFGPLLMIGVYVSACGQISMPLLIVSLPVGLLVMNIVYTHAVMDSVPDKAVGKMTFALRLNTPKAMLQVSFVLNVLPFAGILIGIVAGILSPYYLFTFLLLPLAVALFRMLSAFVHDPDRKFTPRWWMGPMGNWKHFEQLGLDWFLIRWFLARNLLSFFCIILIIISFIR
ncbi:MAG: prenyltransferase [Bacteroidales bacterium]|jgi:1,4-dihydroxy-2-naphthoate octaprenyltransferase|nr:prenyltransferase [Bacteroidales bacterium]